MKRFWALLSIAACFALASDKREPVGETSDDVVDISATAYTTKDEIVQALGSPDAAKLAGSIIVVNVNVRPLSDKPVKLSRDDFMLISNKDGQRAEPFEPSQIAGAGTMVVSVAGYGQVNAGRGGIWGGMGGPFGYPGGGGVGTGGGATGAQAKVENKPGNADPLLTVLQKKILPEKSVLDPISGLLYFEIVGKVKPKDLEMRYTSTSGKLLMRFRQN